MLDSESSSLVNHVILIAEDEELIRSVFAEYMKAVGFYVLEAIHAADALAVLDKAGRIDMVFTDVHMPGQMDGYALADWINEHHPAMPVLLTSGIDKPPIGAHGKHRRFIAKPYALAEVERHIRELVN